MDLTRRRSRAATIDFALGLRNDYAAIQKPRPAFLERRGVVSLRGGAGGITVSVDNGRLTALDVMRSMRANEVAKSSIRR